MITVIGNLKGGTGKSTVAFNLGLWLLSQGHKVEACDLDPQGTLRDASDVRTEEGFVPALTVWGRLPGNPEADILVDVGVSDMPAAKKAIQRAGRVLIPVAPSQADVWSTQRFVEMVEEATAGGDLPEMIAFINRADTHPASRENEEAIEALSQLDHVKVLEDVMLAQRMAFRRSFSEGLGVFELEPRGKASKEIETLARTVFGVSPRKTRRRTRKSTS